MLFVNLDQTYPLSQQYTSDIVCLFVEWVGTEAFYGLAPTTAGLSPEPLCLRSCHYYLTLDALLAGYHFNPLRAHPDTGHSNFQRSVDFLPFLLTGGAIGKGRQHHLGFLFWGVFVSLPLFSAAVPCANCCCILRERETKTSPIQVLTRPNF